jgi:hypothetical protein
MILRKVFYVGLTLLLFSGLTAFYFVDESGSEERVAKKDYKKYAKVKLTTDLNRLSYKDRQMLPLLVEAAAIMDGLFWKQVFPGNRDSLLQSASDEKERAYLKYNYGPWDRLNGNKPFKTGYHAKPLGSNFYPTDMTVEEFEVSDYPNTKSLYTLLRRDKNGKLITVPYHIEYLSELSKASSLLMQASALAESPPFSEYLAARAQALLDDEYTKSDVIWLNMRDNTLDIIIGPIETYEDQLMGYKAAYEAYVLVKDHAWTDRISELATHLPALQKGLPVPDKYKQEPVGTNAQLVVYDAVYYAGDCNSGSKTIAVNLPNDEELQLTEGTRRSQYKNVMKAKFEQILVPISKQLIANDQQEHVKFMAFFSNTMFHEVAHGLGIKNTLNGEGTVRMALKEHASALEEGKADVLGLYMITDLYEKGNLGNDKFDLMDAYVTFMASIFRSVRFGAASAHGKANMVRFNYFKEKGAFTRDPQSGKYRVNPDKMKEAVYSLSAKILTIQGDGDYDEADKLIKEMGLIQAELQGDLDQLKNAGIPVDLVFEQGLEALGLDK